MSTASTAQNEATDRSGAPRSAARAADLTVRDLMCHRSGFARKPVPLRPDPFFSQEWFRQSLAEVVSAIAEVPLLFAPRERVAYSNVAWYVLARIIELRSGRDFGEFVRQEILSPLGMTTDTGFGLPAEKVGRTAVCHSHGEAAGAAAATPEGTPVSWYD